MKLEKYKKSMLKSFDFDTQKEWFTDCITTNHKNKVISQNCMLEFNIKNIDGEYAFSSLIFYDFYGKNYTFDFDEILEVADKMGILEQYLGKEYQDKLNLNQAE